MFGKIIGFDNSTIYIENLKGVADTNYVGFHAIFQEGNHKIVGEIISIDEKRISILLIGEIDNGIYSNGVLKKPNISTIPRIIYKSEIETILGSQDYSKKSTLLFGTSPIYKEFFITSDINSFFANHFAIVGNTGSGKSCGLSRLLQNVFYSATASPTSAHICLFDAYGEYSNTFDEMNKIQGLHFKKITTNTDINSQETLNIPAFLLDADDLACLLEIDSSSELNVLKRTVELVKIFKSNNPRAEEYINAIISQCLLDILSSGKSASQMRDQIISILTNYKTNSLNLDSEIKQPGYSRTFRQCLNIDDQGKINAINLIIDHLNKLASISLDSFNYQELISYDLTDIYNALEFALITERTITANNKNNSLKGKFQSILSSNKVKYFESNEYTSKGEYVEKFFSTNSENAQLVDVNLSYIDDNFAKAITKILSKLFFEHTTNLEHRGSFSVHIILEEAHRYVQNDNDIQIMGYNIFDRITKEGRKYGTILGFITQRPCELSKTALSQCSNFIVFRLFYPDDLKIIKAMSSNVTDETIDKIKTLHPGTCLAFGQSFKIPLLVKFSLPNPLPISTSLKIDEAWYK